MYSRAIWTRVLTVDHYKKKRINLFDFVIFKFSFSQLKLRPVKNKISLRQIFIYCRIVGVSRSVLCFLAMSDATKPTAQQQVQYVVKPPFSNQPQQMKCTHCHAPIMTRVDYQPSSTTHLVALLLCLCTGLCCFIPYCKNCVEKICVKITLNLFSYRCQFV